MVLLYTMCNVDIPNPVKFPYSGKCPNSGFLQGFLHILILGLIYPGKFPYPGKFSYPVKASTRKFTYFSKININ